MANQTNARSFGLHVLATVKEKQMANIDAKKIEDVRELCAKTDDTLQAMASLASVPMDLWDRHSNAVLELIALARSLSSRVEEVERENETQVIESIAVRDKFIIERDLWLEFVNQLPDKRPSLDSTVAAVIEAAALTAERRAKEEVERRLCVNCGRVFPREWDRTKAPADCKSPDACTIDMTAEEAFRHWKAEAHVERTRAEAAETRYAELARALEEANVFIGFVDRYIDGSLTPAEKISGILHHPVLQKYRTARATLEAPND